MKKEENYYELLKVDPKANVADIVTAYHAAKNAFSRDSLAAYSLFSQAETDAVLKKLEEAYFTLSNLDRKREYDRKLAMETLTEESQAQTSELPRPALEIPTSVPAPQTVASTTPAPVLMLVPTPQPEAAPPITETARPLGTEAASVPTPAAATGKTADGTWLKQLREEQGMSIEDVARLTKIPSRYLKAIESNDKAGLPARVYLQGFVANLARVYKVDASSTTKSYLECLDRMAAPARVVGTGGA